MQILPNIASVRAMHAAMPRAHRLALVPTMGALHEGHASLVRRAVAENDQTLVSIFVNPTQFGPNEDFDRYPRNLEQDSALLAELGVDYVFAPDVREIYPTPPAQFYFDIRDMDKKLCGARRPGHMNGVVQVVSMLFHIVQPDTAYFGLKDYQQCLILQQLVKELHFPLSVVPCPIVREADGLAMSSRNIYLSPEERKQAVALNQILNALRDQKASFATVTAAKDFVAQQLERYPLVKPDYVEIYHGQTLQEIPDLRPAHFPHAFIAAYLGKTRLIDNMPLY